MRVAHPQPEVGRHLVVARARGVQAPGGLADQFAEPALDIHVDVFERAAEGELAALDLRQDRVETLCDLFGVVRRNDALLGQHVGMGLGRHDVLAVKSLVEIDRGVDLLHDGAGAGGKPPAPHLVAHDRNRGSSPEMTETRPATAGTKGKRLALIMAGALAGAVVGFAGVYGVSTMKRNAGGDPACRPAVELAKKLAPLAHGEVAAVNVAKAPLKLPDLAFSDADGKPVTLASFAGRTVLLNLWATWCVPCRKEMPTLDALQAKLGGPGFEVVAVNIDTRDPDKPKQFLDEIGVKKLALLRRPERQGVPGPQGHRPRLRHADHGPGRRQRLRNRHHRRPRRMGER